MKDLAQRIKDQQDSINRKAERVQEIIDNTKDQVLEPGYYDVVEADGGGMRDYTQFQIMLERQMNQKEVALILIEEKNYMSPWNRLDLRKANPPKVFTIK